MRRTALVLALMLVDAAWAQAAPSIDAISPAAGGNSGVVTVALSGQNFLTGATIKITRSGQLDIPGTGVLVAADGLSLSATLDMNGKALGLWNVVVTNPDAQTATLANGFTVETFVAPQLRVDLVGPDGFKSHFMTPFDLVIQNSGNVDALSVPLWMTGIPTDATVGLGFPLASPPQDGGEPDWGQLQDTLTTEAGRYLALVIPRVPPGTVTRRVWLTVPIDGFFQLTAAVTPPWLDGTTFRTCLADGGAIGNTACMGTQLVSLNAYLAGHPEVEALNGIGLWAKIGWQCEGASTLVAALDEAKQVLGLMVKRVEQQGVVPPSCSQVLEPSWRQARSILVVSLSGGDNSAEKFGAVASGSLITNSSWLPFTIEFEKGSVPFQSATHVTVSDVLDSDLDPATVILGRISIGNDYRDPPPSARSYSQDVPLGTGSSVRVVFNLVGSQLVWTFDGLQGPFLPPNDPQGIGRGSVQFTVRPRATTPNGTPIANPAVVTFDGAQIPTSTWTSTVDNTPPASHVTGVTPSAGALSHTVSWTADSSPDVKDYTVCISEDGAPYRAWRTNTTVTADTLGASSDHHPHSYTFYSTARDQVGNLEGTPITPDVSVASVVAADPPGDGDLALEGARPNPVLDGSMNVWFTLANRERATLGLIDLAGRRVVWREVGALGPGPHLVTLATSKLKSGIYFLRLHQQERVMQRRVVLMR